MAEVSLGRSVALAALAPIAGRLADEGARRDAARERRLQLERALAAVPPIERPTSPAPAYGVSLSERIPAMFAWTCGLFLPLFWAVNAVPALIHHHDNVGYANPLLALFLAGLLGVLLGGLRYWRALYRLDRERRTYELELRAAEAREAEREAIEASFEEHR